MMNAESFDATRMTTRDVDALRGMIDDIKALDKSERTATKDDEVGFVDIMEAWVKDYAGDYGIE